MIVGGLLIVCIFVCWAKESLTEKNIDSDLQTVMKSYDAIGISVVVVKDNQICYKNTIGYNPDYNDTTRRVLISDNAVYWWASVSKTFISTAVMQLVERKKVSLNDDVNKYLDFNVRNPRFPLTPITIQMLLCHRSSLNDNKYSWGFDMLMPDKNKDWKNNYNQYEPGKGYDYCNLNYNLLAAIIEKATNTRFDDYIGKNITEPLSIYGSFNKLRLDSSLFVKTYSYNQEKKIYEKYHFRRHYDSESLGEYVLGNSTPTFSPAGGMRTTVEGLARWMMVHMNYGTYKNRQILSKESELLMWEPKGPESRYGFAFSHYDKVVKGENFVGMTGGSCGIHSAMFFNPEKKFGFVVICNGCTSKSANGAEMNYKIVRVLYKHLIEGKK